MKVPVVKEILKANDQMAEDNRRLFRDAGVWVLNLMASPGAGKTSLILATLDRLPEMLRAGVVEGDVASSIDADRIADRGTDVVQVNTGGSCHLDAPMVRSALEHLPLAELDLLFVENVGNLICPTSFDLGADLAVAVGSVPEGDDKPYKYPGLFAQADVVVLNKMDLVDAFDFDLDYYERGVRMVNADVPVFPVSCRTGDGLWDWADWLMDQTGGRERSARHRRERGAPEPVRATVEEER